MRQIEQQYDDRVETIVYGGAFNPPTLAHQAILQATIHMAEQRNADVWLMPSGNRSDKTIDVPYAQRMRLLFALTRDVIARTVTVAIETSELKRQIPVETYDTVQELADRYPDRRFVHVFGMDSIGTMHEWKEGEWLFDNLEKIVVNRPGIPQYDLAPQDTTLTIETMDTSSTLVKERLRAGLPVDDLVPPAVNECLMTY